MPGSRLPHGLVDEVSAHLSVTWDAQARLQALDQVWEDSPIVAAGEGKRLRVNILEYILMWELLLLMLLLLLLLMLLMLVRIMLLLLLCHYRYY